MSWSDIIIGECEHNVEATVTNKTQDVVSVIFGTEYRTAMQQQAALVRVWECILTTFVLLLLVRYLETVIIHLGRLNYVVPTLISSNMFLKLIVFI